MPDAVEPWSDSELRVCIGAYLRLLAAQLKSEGAADGRLGDRQRGEYLSKKAIRAEAQAAGLIRSAASYERRMSNISAVASGMGLPTVDGYVPLEHVGTGVSERLTTLLRERASDFPDVFASGPAPPAPVGRRYWTNVYTPATWKTASERGFTITGFTAPRETGPGGYHEVHFDRVSIGDYFLCYVTDAMKWTGILRVESESFPDTEPIWGTQSDGRPAFPIRFRVSPVAVLELAAGIPRDAGYDSLTRKTGGEKRGLFAMGLREVAAEDAEQLLRRLQGKEPASISAAPIELEPSLPRTEPTPPIAGLTLEWLVEQTNWEQQALKSLIDAVENTSPQIILAGPPGTSKTWVAKHLIRFLTQDKPIRSKIIQFHPTYGYEEFIEGLRPVADDDGAIKFERVDGIVLAYVDEIGKAKESEPCFLLIDEMNRANLSRVFGELMYLFEYRDDPVDLRYTKGWKLPANLKFVGTMNTADRSIRSIDIALRRRFDVFECQPDASILERFYGEGKSVNEVPDLVGGFIELNQQLEAALDRHHTIGHAFFMESPMTAERLSAIWNRKIGPLIEEYFFDRPEDAKSFTLSKFWPSVGDAD